ncbi:peptidoglycan-binding domain-containing protein [Mycobacteroides abscessus]|uniref:peptidoglycan-binding domain-containing protein n=1 Tax=Mycobacteroides abscessus TaxID=36809 RepID=UPI000A59AC15|nr:peptidoglycan-binding domain-containing protein [Mycobacteroides abscessus]
MAWQQPQLADPPMGPTDEIRKLQHRLLFAYPGRSDAHNLGVIESGVFDPATDRALRNMQEYLAATEDGKYNSKPGVLTYDCKTRLGVVLAAPKAPAKRFVQQGVGFSTDAFLMGDPTHSYVDARTEGSTELLRLALPMVGVPKIWIGYSMGDDVVNTALLQWPEDRRDEIKLIIGFGGPSRRPGPTLLGNDPGGQGISGVFGPDWAASRTYQFTHKATCTPTPSACCRGCTRSSPAWKSRSTSRPTCSTCSSPPSGNSYSDCWPRRFRAPARCRRSPPWSPQVRQTKSAARYSM